MIAYHFRVMENGKPNGWIGLAVAHDMRDLVFAIDEYVDPYAVQIQVAKEGGYCRKIVQVDDVYEEIEVEISEFEPFLDDENWITPPWVEEKA